MPTWRNMPSMPKVRASSGTIGTTCLPMFLSFTSICRMRTSAMVVENSRSPDACSSESKASSAGTSSARRIGAPLRQVAAEHLAPLAQVLHLLAVFGRLLERRVGDLLVGDLHEDAIAEFLERLVVELLLLVRDVLALAPAAHHEAFDGLREDHGRLALVIHRGVIGVPHLLVVVAAAVQPPDVVVRHGRDHLLQLGILAEEVLARVRAALGFEVLVLAVDAFLHHPAQQALGVARQQRIPARAPDHLDDVPAGAEERGFQLLDDLAVAAHRTVEALQVAVDHEHQVVELLAHRHGDRAQRLRLVHFAVAEERPDLAVRRRHDAAMLEIALKARLVDRHHRARGPWRRSGTARTPASATDADTSSGRRGSRLPGGSDAGCSR